MYMLITVGFLELHCPCIYDSIRKGHEAMRILIVTRGTIPGCSGGWTTPLDLLQPDHEVAYVAALGPPGNYHLEDVPVFALSGWLRFEREWPFLNMIRLKLAGRAFSRHLLNALREFKPDLTLCLDEYCARLCMDLGVPYAVRMHSRPTELHGRELERVLQGALFTTLSPSVDIPGYEVLNHAVDLKRFLYLEHPSARRVIMVSTLNHMRDPELFIEGLNLSCLTGTIVGDGVLRETVRTACDRTGGKVEYMAPVTRNKLPELLQGYQIGVACHRKVDIIYQMKVNEYMASGIYPLVMPWTHLASEAPSLTMTFKTPEELASRIDWLANHWDETLEVRRRGREFVLGKYDIHEPRMRFKEILDETFNEHNLNRSSGS